MNINKPCKHCDLPRHGKSSMCIEHLRAYNADKKRESRAARSGGGGGGSVSGKVRRRAQMTRAEEAYIAAHEHSREHRKTRKTVTSRKIDENTTEEIQETESYVVRDTSSMTVEERCQTEYAEIHEAFERAIATTFEEYHANFWAKTMTKTNDLSTTAEYEAVLKQPKEFMDEDEREWEMHMARDGVTGRQTAQRIYEFAHPDSEDPATPPDDLKRIKECDLPRMVHSRNSFWVADGVSDVLVAFVWFDCPDSAEPIGTDIPFGILTRVPGWFARTKALYRSLLRDRFAEDRRLDMSEYADIVDDMSRLSHKD